jgi:hypothetical protein
MLEVTSEIEVFTVDETEENEGTCEEEDVGCAGTATPPKFRYCTVTELAGAALDP